MIMETVLFYFVALAWASTSLAHEEVPFNTSIKLNLKNDEYLTEKIIPDIQFVVQKQLNDKKFETLNMFLVILKNSLIESGYRVSKGNYILFY